MVKRTQTPREALARDYNWARGQIQAAKQNQKSVIRAAFARGDISLSFALAMAKAVRTIERHLLDSLDRKYELSRAKLLKESARTIH